MLGMSVEHERRALALHDACQRLHAVDQGALIGRGKAQQHGGDVGGRKRAGKRVPQPVRIGSLRGHKIEARGRAPRFGRFPSGRHGRSIAPAIGRFWGRL